MSLFKKGERVVLRTKWNEYSKGEEGRIKFVGGDGMTVLGGSCTYSVTFSNGVAEGIPEGDLESVEEQKCWQEEVIEKLSKIESLLKTYPNLKEPESKKIYNYLEVTQQESKITNLNKNKRLIAGNLYCIVAILNNTLDQEKEIKSLIQELAKPLGVGENFFK
ncbi:hypothetical protein [Anabaena subtropica]|uniref:Uncharacterized protein n=1 Tax=Anabaena subtropica FACHB-260 TaxID=2692884 RepID=A0ABR8CPU0_9NOST|nr:hypothetical protein [Anabaena subtropica]MBD2344944.1 hypothetical protein [Anabaena subtropica FACHB-260]